MCLYIVSAMCLHVDVCCGGRRERGEGWGEGGGRGGREGIERE